MKNIVATTLVLTSIAMPQSLYAKDTRPYLTLEAAKNGAAECERFAKENDLSLAISIKDRGGRTVYFQRMDDVYQKQAEFAGIKAETASTTPISTKRLGEVTTQGSPLAGLVYVPGLNGVEGGEPIKLENGYSIGGVGVSGASPAQDGVCARLVTEAIASAYLK